VTRITWRPGRRAPGAVVVVVVAGLVVVLVVVVVLPWAVRRCSAGEPRTSGPGPARVGRHKCRRPG